MPMRRASRRGIPNHCPRFFGNEFPEEWENFRLLIKDRSLVASPGIGRGSRMKVVRPLGDCGQQGDLLIFTIRFSLLTRLFKGAHWARQRRNHV